jgi:parallel beta-helix repeat protein
VVGNEIQDVHAIGILVQASAATRVEGNQLYRNGYGIATVLSEPPSAVRVRDNLLLAQTVDGLIVIGDSPLVADNRVRQNRLAGIRVLDWASAGTTLRASPNLVGNELANNGVNEPVFAVLHAPGGGAR